MLANADHHNIGVVQGQGFKRRKLGGIQANGVGYFVFKGIYFFHTGVYANYLVAHSRKLHAQRRTKIP